MSIAPPHLQRVSDPLLQKTAGVPLIRARTASAPGAVAKIQDEVVGSLKNADSVQTLPVRRRDQ